MRKVSVCEHGKYFRVSVTSDQRIPEETLRRMPWAARVTHIDRHEEPNACWVVFQVGKAACDVTARRLESDMQAYFDAEELRSATYHVDTRSFPNPSSITVGKLIELARRGNPFARKVLEDLSETWAGEHRAAIADLLNLRSVCPNDRDHFIHQRARAARRDKLIACVEAFLGGDDEGSNRIAKGYDLF